jgi:hypothetical protein
MQQRGVKDVGRFTQGTQGRGVDAEALLHGGQGRRLLQAPQAGHQRVKKVQQQPIPSPKLVNLQGLL